MNFVVDPRLLLIFIFSANKPFENLQRILQRRNLYECNFQFPLAKQEEFSAYQIKFSVTCIGCKYEKMRELNVGEKFYNLTMPTTLAHMYRIAKFGGSNCVNNVHCT